MVKKILVVQSRTDPERIEREQKRFRIAVGSAAHVDFLSAVDEKLAWTTPADFLKGYDGVMFGGSSEFDFDGGRPERDPARIISAVILSRAKNLISYALAEDIPLLAICYGHQLVANMYGGDVDNDKEQSKFGSYEVQLTEAGKGDLLFKDMPESFIAQYAHNDSVTKLPAGATLLASSKGCRFSALRYGKKAYTTQFHPEVTRFDDLPVEYRESAEASKLIGLWIERVVA
jgi:GMP synthase-like glutamine amidotransferase